MTEDIELSHGEYNEIAKNKTRRRTNYKYKRSNKCNDCSAITKTQFHHDDYGDPDRFVELCPKWHTKRHRKLWGSKVMYRGKIYDNG